MKDAAKNFMRLWAHRRDVRRPREFAIDNNSKVLVRVNMFDDRRVQERGGREDRNDWQINTKNEQPFWFSQNLVNIYTTSR